MRNLLYRASYEVPGIIVGCLLGIVCVVFLKLTRQA